MRKRIFAIVALAAQPAFAADPLAGDWGGFHAGVQAGQMTSTLDYRGTPIQSGTADSWGVHAGYTVDLGPHMLGAEADLNRFKGGNADLIRLRGRAGVDLGRFQPYLVLGVARLAGDGITETAPVFGVGGDWKISDRLTVGIEYTIQEFEDVLKDETGFSGYDLELELVQARASWRF